ncbi:DNA-directed RNA polymerase sigma-70 factor [Echinicola pacifica]|uniref:DNA-directed RNA polymerase sigma-70 factor n=1 Tax=Echinicola pacifica TaxID=346377 RepID=A0A918PU89_9BACT|nr:sigma-70 family RNA polymerase sigma factor [Echinicola pacifica]GGZ22969.1 DNA-directed RNA polymerase sigma-70 factor [Echinicola pacifica]
MKVSEESLFTTETLIEPKISNSHNSSEKDLWDLFKSGSKAAFVRIYEDHFDSLYNFGMCVCGKDDLTKDAIHDVFFDLRKNASKVGPTDSIKFYLFRCLKRRLIREQKNWGNRKSGLDSNQFIEIGISQEELMINQQLNNEQAQKLLLGLNSLSPRQKEVIFYLFYEGMSYVEIQELMGLSCPKSARDLAYKALKSLREIMTCITIIGIASAFH